VGVTVSYFKASVATLNLDCLNSHNLQGVEVFKDVIAEAAELIVGQVQVHEVGQPLEGAHVDRAQSIAAQVSAAAGRNVNRVGNHSNDVIPLTNVYLHKLQTWQVCQIASRDICQIVS
jgi:hypothetical protein